MRNTASSVDSIVGLKIPPSRRGGKSAPAKLEKAELHRFLAIQFFSVIYLQKLSIPLPEMPPVSVPLIIMLAGLLEMMRRSQLRFSPIALCIFCAFAAAAVMSQFLVPGAFSLPSLLLLLVLSAEFTILWEVEALFYDKLIDIFSRLMILPAIMVFAQLVWQSLAGWGHALSIEPLIPNSLLLPGYLYEAPIRHGAKFIRPNGFFMLEPSYVSAMLALAILVETRSLRRIGRILLFLTALIGTMGATGMVMLAAAAPFVLARQSRRFVLGFATVCAAGLLAAWPLGVGDQFIHRLSELEVRNSSGTERLVLPARQLVAALGDPGGLVTGQGAGQVDGSSGNAWPMVKLAREYGLLVMTLYMCLFLTALCRCPNLPLQIGVFVAFHLTGGYLLNPIMVETILLLCTILVPTAAAGQTFGTGMPAHQVFGRASEKMRQTKF